MQDCTDHIDRKRLSIRLSTDGFSFASGSAEGSGQLSVLEYPVNPALSLGANLTGASEAYLASSQRASIGLVRLSIVTSRHMDMPSELFDHARIQEIFLSVLRADAQEVVLSSEVREIGTHFLFATDRSIPEIVQSCFPGSTIEPCCQASLLARSLHASSSGQRLHVFIGRRHMTLTAFSEKDSLLLSRTILTFQNQDRIFFILSLFKNLQLSQEETPLHLAAEGHILSEILPTLQKYIRHIIVADYDKVQWMDHRENLTCES